MSDHLVDNSSEELSMVVAFREALSVKKLQEIRIATGYWDLPGFALVAEDLDAFLNQSNNAKIYLLLGQDPRVTKAQLINGSETRNGNPMEYPKDYIAHDLETLEVKEEYSRAVEILRKYIGSEGNGQIEVRVHRSAGEVEVNFLHAKCYIFSGSREANAIIGSSNFTRKGFQENNELNSFVTNPLIIQGATVNSYYKTYTSWFDEHWEQSTDWGQIFIEVLSNSKHGKSKGGDPVLPPIPMPPALKPLTYYELYIKYVMEQLGDVVSKGAHQELEGYLPDGFTAYSYQMDAVMQCFHIMKKHGGFILADVVGLGKTVVAMLLVRKFLQEAENLKRNPSVLVLTPPSVLPAWERTAKQFLPEGYPSDRMELVSSGRTISLGEEALASLVQDLNLDVDEVAQSRVPLIQSPKRKNYGLILIDESHHFRNGSSRRSKSLDQLIGAVETETGHAPYVGLLSATPMNNQPNDLLQQLLLFHRNESRSQLYRLQGTTLRQFFRKKQQEFQELRKSQDPKAPEQIRQVAQEIREKVLQDLVVRRTRHDLRTHYSEDAEALRFPNIAPPISLTYKMTREWVQLFEDTIDAIVGREPLSETTSNVSSQEAPKGRIKFARWAVLMYFKDPEITRRYEAHNMTVESISNRLANIYQGILIKRLESSKDAFKVSLRRVKQSTEEMIEMLDRDMVYVLHEYNVSSIIRKHGSLEKAIPELDQKIAKRKDLKNVRYRASDFRVDELRAALLSDLEVINPLLERWEKNDDDPKLDAFKKTLWTKLFDPKINNPIGSDTPKLIIFTEAIPTAEILYKKFNDDGEHHPLLVTAENRDTLADTIRANFDANLPESEWKIDYDVIITTEVLAEGVNLHRANVLLNYDIPWNSTRLMQRLGRINRIGSRQEMIYSFNFYPSEEGNSLIGLYQIAYAKLQAFHTLFGEDSKVFSDDELLPEGVSLDQLMDGEASPYATHIMALKRFEEKEPQRYEEIKQLPFESLGGLLPSEVDEGTLAVLQDEDKRLHNFIKVGKSPWQPIWDDVVMDRLQRYAEHREEEVPPTLREGSLQSVWPSLLTIFRDTAEAYSTSKDSPNLNGGKAMTVLRNCLRPLIGLPGIAELYQSLEQKVRDGNRFIIQQLLQLGNKYPEVQGHLDEHLDEIEDHFRQIFSGFVTEESHTEGAEKVRISLLLEPQVSIPLNLHSGEKEV